MSKEVIKEKAVLYARYSSDGQRAESIEGQLRECRSYAKRLGLLIVGEYCDYAITGTMDRRPEFQRMIKDAGKHQFTVVLCWKHDRFARNRYDAATYRQRLKQNGVRILYAQETVPEGPEGIILESVMEGMAEYYSANLSQNVRRGMYDSALKLGWLGQKTYGLRPGADGRYELDPDTAPVVRRIFEEYAAGRSSREIYTELNEAGHRTMTGGLFNKNSLRRILQNEKYCGVYTYADIRVEDGIPAIVSKDLFREVQKMVKQHHEKPAAKKTDGGFLLTGKLFCGKCGELMTGDGGTGKSGKVYAYYTCNNRRRKKCDKARAPKEWIEDVVVRKLAEIANSDEVIEAFADRYMIWQDKERDRTELRALEAKRKQVEEAIGNLTRVLESGVVSEAVLARLREREEEKAALDKGIAQALLEEPVLERDQVVYFLERFREGDVDDPKWRVYLVEVFLRAVYLYDDGTLLLDLNFTGDKGRVSVKLAEEATAAGDALCSNLEPSAPPQGANLNTVVFFYAGHLLVKASAK